MLQGLAGARRLAANAFILAYLGSVAIWLLPSQNLLFRELQDAVAPEVGLLGFWQCWDMFAPAPVTSDRRLFADVQFSDGTVRRWHFLDASMLSPWQRLMNDRRRKWIEDLTEGNAMGYGDACVYAARQLYRPGGPRPVVVTLGESITPLPPLGVAAPPERSRVVMLHRHVLRAGELAP